MPKTISVESLLKNAEEAAKLCQICGNSRRLLILCFLLKYRRLSVSEICELIPEITQSALSQHLDILKTKGLISMEKSAQLSYYSILDPCVKKILKTLKEIYCP